MGFDAAMPADLMRGYKLESDGTAICLFCQKRFDGGEVFPIDGRFFLSEEAVCRHIEASHEGVFHALSADGADAAGLTDKQWALMALVHQGLGDKEIAEHMGTAASTVRVGRYHLREKAAKARLFLALYGLMEAKAQKGDEPMHDIHASAVMVDERYMTTQAEAAQICARHFLSQDPPVLKNFPAREKRKVVVLARIAEAFDMAYTYTEKEVNAVLKAIYPDFATLRRYLIEYGFMSRAKDGSAYRRNA